MSKLKLTYFETKDIFFARGEPIRLVLYIGGIDFEDERITHEELNKRRSNTPYGSLPLLTLEDGEVMAQSNAIMRFLGKRTKLYPEDHLLAMRVDELIYGVEDILSKMTPIIYDPNPEKKKEGFEKINTEILPHWVNLIEKRIEKFGKGYSVGENLTISDIFLYQFFGSILHGRNPFLQGISSESIKKATKLTEVIKKISEHPKISEWNKIHNKHSNLYY
eukprot:TRINITY_DN11884_c0_g1_i1.p1 TRINITY_DN11884_c0_g1~~TRINITY_DN11884_c0_g1_i1.p1  ORF type:complete len:220 (-),score=55.34 TRINITY_DN11884_c0_g1_i1:15-674(-)